MRLGLLFLLTTMFLPCAARWAEGQSPNTAAQDRPKPRTDARISIVRQVTGQRALMIDYPWQVHAKPSVEIRLVTGDQADTSAVRPLFFVAEMMKGEVLVKVQQCLQAAFEAGTTRQVSKDGVDLDILGRRNSLGQPAVCVAARTKKDDPAPGVSGVFCLLDSWAKDRHTLCLDLPQEYFDKPGDLYIWFLRGDTVLWRDRADWPGYAASR
jgi:hypothetical protein